LPINDRTRKILWVTAGGRCSICRVPLVTEATSLDDPSVFGEEAHIVAQSRGGPRAGSATDPDSYDNLILLCRKDHKRIDDQTGYYTVARLKEIKRRHEQWMRSLDNYEKLATKDAFRFAVEIVSDLSTAEVPMLSGRGSKVLKLDLERGGYRVNARAEGGLGNFIVNHESSRSRANLVAIGFLNPTDSKEIITDERLLRVDDGGRHLFSIKAPAGTRWEIRFTQLQ
jgi:hypothetical protein